MRRRGFVIIFLFQFDLINPKKVERKGYRNSGQIVVKSVKIEQVRKHNHILTYSLTCTQDTTFLDYVRGGLKINLSVAVDMTGSNGDPDSPQSLHYIHPRTGENAYTTAIRTVGEILQDYDFGEQW
jgi:hypothetical protein